MTPPRFKVMGKWLTPKQTWYNWWADNPQLMRPKCWLFGHKWLWLGGGWVCTRCAEYKLKEIPQ
jgi:hypothetical protein